MLSPLLVCQLHARLRPPPRTSRQAPYSSSHGQVSGVKWHNTASYISIVCNPLHVQPMCVLECLRVLAHTPLLIR